MPNQTLQYLSYLLRCWEEERQTPYQPAVWRFSLENVQTGERYAFVDFDALLAFLHTQLKPTPSLGDEAGLDD